MHDATAAAVLKEHQERLKFESHPRCLVPTAAKVAADAPFVERNQYTRGAAQNNFRAQFLRHQLHMLAGDGSNPQFALRRLQLQFCVKVALGMEHISVLNALDGAVRDYHAQLCEEEVFEDEAPCERPLLDKALNDKSKLATGVQSAHVMLRHYTMPPTNQLDRKKEFEDARPGLTFRDWFGPHLPRDPATEPGGIACSVGATDAIFDLFFMDVLCGKRFGRCTCAEHVNIAASMGLREDGKTVVPHANAARLGLSTSTVSPPPLPLPTPGALTSAARRGQGQRSRAGVGAGCVWLEGCRGQHDGAGQQRGCPFGDLPCFLLRSMGLLLPGHAARGGLVMAEDEDGSEAWPAPPVGTSHPRWPRHAHARVLGGGQGQGQRLFLGIRGAGGSAGTRWAGPVGGGSTF